MQRFRFLILPFVLLFASASVSAQTRPAPVVTLQGAASANANGAIVSVAAYGGIVAQITGTFSATVNFEITLDGTNYVAAQAYNLTTAAYATSATAAGIFTVYAPGALYFRARISSYSSGSVTVTARPTPALVSKGSSGGGGDAAWGDITGTLSDQTDLQTALDLKAPLASPTFTGTVAAAAATFTGAITQTSNSATAFSSGPNGATNPVFRIVNNTASQADGVSVTGGAAGSGTTIAALSSGANSGINITPKGTGRVQVINGTTSAYLYIYDTFTDASNYRRLSLIDGRAVLLEAAGTEAGTPMYVGTQSGNTELNFRTGGTDRWVIGTVGHFTSQSDGNYDIGGASTRVRNLFAAGYWEGTEMADPAAPAANKGRLYFRDNGSGKTELVVIFPTGAVQVIATEP